MSECLKTQKKLTRLANHMRTHTGEKHLKCEICGFQCGDSSNLSKHRKSKSLLYSNQEAGSLIGKQHTNPLSTHVPSAKSLSVDQIR